MVEADGARARIDFVETRPSGRVGLLTLANAVRPSESALDDLAFALALARRAGMDVESAAVLHWNGDCVRGDAAPAARALLRRSVVTREVEFLARDVPARVARLREVLTGTDEPAIEPSPHCRRPEPCPFLPRCTGALPDDWIGFLPGLRQPESDAFREQAVTRIGELPAGKALPAAQANARAAVAKLAAYGAPDLARRLQDFAPAADALDFEAILPDVPLFPGTRPLEFVPFQWSAHLAGDDGGFAHAEFLAEPGAGDPRRAFAESLLAAFGGRARPIAVYSDFEAETLEALGRAFPELEPGLAALRARLRDLLPVVRRSVYHPAFRGSFALKRVAPVLVPDFGFADLAPIADGGAASRAWLEMVLGEADAEHSARLCAALRAYCARDSLALVRLLDALRGLAGAPS